MKKLSKKMMIFKFKTDFKIKNYKILYKIKISKRSKKLKKFKKSKKLKKLKKIRHIGGDWDKNKNYKNNNKSIF